MRRSEMLADSCLYESARIRAKENGLIGKDRMERLLDAGNTDRAIALLAEFGVELISDPQTGSFQREETLAKRLGNAYEELLTFAPDADFLKLWLYPYDCNNIKAAIKCKRRGVDCGEMLFRFGTVNAEDVVKMAEENRFEGLGEPFATAAQEASDTFSRTGNPQMVDLILDRACYRAMLETAEQSGVAFCVRLVKRKIDLVNLTICVRLLRMNSGELGKSLLQDALLSGGYLSVSDLTELYDMGEAMLWEKLLYTDYRSFSLAVGGANATLTKVETEADNAWMETVCEAKSVAYGPEILVGYLIATEYEVRNVRILLAGFGVALSAHTIRERIRNSYV